MFIVSLVIVLIWEGGREMVAAIVKAILAALTGLANALLPLFK